MTFIVTAAARRPASDKHECFYCNQAVGAEHKPDCVLISKKVKVRATIEYEIEVPAHWESGMTEFHRNESSWCKDNMIRELQAIADLKNDCLCSHVEFEYLCDTSKPFLSEE